MSAVKKQIASVIAEVSGLPPAKVLTLVVDDGYEHVVQNNNPFYSNEIQLSQLLANAGEVFFSRPVTSIMASELTLDNESDLIAYKKEFNKSSQKSQILSGIEEQLQLKVKSESLRSDVMLIADEMITNAIFNAPFVNLQNTSSGIDRQSEEFEMRDGKFGEVTLALDEEKILLLCRDDFGTLNPEVMLKKIRHIYQTNVAENINMAGQGGAGIGTFMIFNSSVSFFVGVKKNNCTLIGCLLPIKGSSKKRQEMFKNVHFILAE